MSTGSSTLPGAGVVQHATIPGTADLLLRLSGVHTHIGAYHILHGVDLDVPVGRTTLLLGRNGAGKTTTLRTIMGLWKASQGTVAFGADPVAVPSSETRTTSSSKVFIISQAILRE